MATEITDTFVSERLRSIRRAQSLSLNDVEIASNGAIKAVVLGSYERGSRSLSVKRAIQIAKAPTRLVKPIGFALITTAAIAQILRPQGFMTLRACPNGLLIFMRVNKN